MITIGNLHKRFNTGKVDEVYALRGINLHVQPGEFVTVIGTNGSGKSTLLNAVAGGFLPDEGRIEIAGVDLTRAHDWQRARLVSRVFQNPFMGTAAAMSIAENLHMAGLRGSRLLPRRGLDRHHLDGCRAGRARPRRPAPGIERDEPRPVGPRQHRFHPLPVVPARDRQFSVRRR